MSATTASGINIDKQLADSIRAVLEGKASNDQFEAVRKSVEVIKADKTEFPKLEKIILPPGMTYGIGARVLQEMEASENKEVKVFRMLHGIPADCLIAMWHAIKIRYGFSSLQDTQSFFGPIPPMMVNLPVGVGENTSVPYGKISPPAWEKGYIQPSLTDTGDGIAIVGQVKQKFVDTVNEIMDEAEKTLATASIYKGKAIDLDLSYLGNKDGYNPTTMSPTFCNPSRLKKEDLILNADAAMMYKLNIFSRLENQELIKRLGMTFKHGVLLSGPFGVGKTQSAAVIQRLAVENNITFINLKTPLYFAQALELGRKYGPTVLFVEDIDALFEGQERTHGVNSILNTLDGVKSKDAFDVLVVLTTNNVKAISAAMMRAGRIDTLVCMDYPDASTVGRFIKYFGKSYISEEVANDTDVCAKLAGRAPAFINKIVLEALMSAHLRDEANPQIAKEDLLLLATQSIKHEDLARLTESTPIDRLHEAVETLREDLGLQI